MMFEGYAAAGKSCGHSVAVDFIAVESCIMANTIGRK